MKVFLPGGAGLVGLNLIALLQQQHPEWQLLVVDKKREAVEAGRTLFPAVEFLCEDLISTEGMQWPARLAGCDACVMLQAEIGNTDPTQFERNNIQPPRWCSRTEAQAIPLLVHVSGSVVNSVATTVHHHQRPGRAGAARLAGSDPAALMLAGLIANTWAGWPASCRSCRCFRSPAGR